MPLATQSSAFQAPECFGIMLMMNRPFGLGAPRFFNDEGTLLRHRSASGAWRFSPASVIFFIRCLLDYAFNMYLCNISLCY